MESYFCGPDPDDEDHGPAVIAWCLIILSCYLLLLACLY